MEILNSKKNKIRQISYYMTIKRRIEQNYMISNLACKKINGE